MDKDYKKIDIRNRVTRINNFYDSKIIPYQNQIYEDLKRECSFKNKLFIDPLFQANNKSLFYKSSTPSGIIWKRARDIALEQRLKPKFIENNAHANDLNQGYIGDCWFIAATAALAQLPDLFYKVVPKDQSFDDGQYFGIFHFRFWLYGQWYDVVIDDFLPVYRDNSLVFCKNKIEPNEFWAALIEKAYAKIYGSYENLDGGFTADALVDMSGGIQETYDLKNMQNDTFRNELWEIIKKSRQLKSMTAAYIEGDPYTREARLYNGLVMGHAYTITRIALIDYRGRDLKLIRLRNPWGNEVEWKGSWSDESREWNSISDDLKNQLDFKKAKEGEFWMAYDDFYKNFHNIQFCNLTPDAFSEEVLSNKFNKNNSSWKMVAYHGDWVNGKSAGGCGQGNQSLFWMNPQFLVTLTNPDSDNNNNNKCTIIISLLQKFTREKRMKFYQDSLEEFIQFRIFKIKNSRDVEVSKRNGGKLYANQLEKVGSSEAYINRREITKRFILAPGDYLIIPSCYDYGNEGEFLLRIFTEEIIDERNIQVLTEDKKILKDEDIYFFKTVNSDQSFSSWINLLGDVSLSDDNAKPSYRRPNSSLHSSPTSNSESENSGYNAISNLVIRSGFSGNNKEEVTQATDHENNFSKDFDIHKIIAKIENKNTVKEACNIM